MLVEIDALSGDGIRGVNTLSCDVDHNSDEGMLFDVEGTRVQRDGISECLDAPVREVAIHCLSESEGK